MGFIFFFIVTYLLICLTLSWIFPKAGIESSKAWIPGINFGKWCEIIGRKPSHAWWLLFPIVNIFIFCGMCIDLVRSFGRMSFAQSALSVIFPPAAFYPIGKQEEIKYLGPAHTKEKELHIALQQAIKNKDVNRYNRLKADSPFTRSMGREWTESIIFAVFAAAFIRMFLIEAYVIPTPSMEGSLKVGDFLFVSKAHYGIRTPMTIAMLPLLHNRIPYLNTESYLRKPSLHYHRLPALVNINRNDPIVFNWPAGDSVYITKTRSYNYLQTKIDPTAEQETRGLQLIVRPVDKKDHYIKRCVAIPGDSLQIINRQIYINGQLGVNPKEMQWLTAIISPTPLSEKRLSQWGVNVKEKVRLQSNVFAYFITLDQMDKIKSISPDIELNSSLFDRPTQFPNDPIHFPDWTSDNFGPIWIPKKGSSIELNLKTIALYARIISVYENNMFEYKDNQFWLNGQPATHYTFKQDYYWSMGDNRHNSEDSRYWGYVPHDHIVGKPLFIWFSLKNGNLKDGVNWKRIFRSANH